MLNPSASIWYIRAPRHNRITIVSSSNDSALIYLAEDHMQNNFQISRKQPQRYTYYKILTFRKWFRVTQSFGPYQLAHLHCKW